MAGGLVSSLQAEEPIRIVERTVVAGVATTIGEFYELNADCFPVGDIQVRVLKNPKNGTAESEDAVLVPNFPLINQRAECNKRKNQGVVVIYQAKPGYSGKDTFEIEAIFPRGASQKYRFMVQVRA
jgi:hypothetical protein